MNFIFAFFKVVYMAFTSRLSGAHWGFLDKRRITWLPEMFFAAGFAYALYKVIPPYIEVSFTVPFIVYSSSILADNFIALLCLFWSYIWMQTGHGAVLHWGKEVVKNPDRRQFLTPTVDFIAKVLRIEKNSTNYCRLFMGVKGFLIGLPVGGLPMFFLWPLGYEIGVRLRGKVRFDPHIASEVAAGAGAGISIVLFLLIFS